jgi:hypothetical protein
MNKFIVEPTDENLKLSYFEENTVVKLKFTLLQNTNLG